MFPAWTTKHQCSVRRCAAGACTVHGLVPASLFLVVKSMLQPFELLTHSPTHSSHASHTCHSDLTTHTHRGRYSYYYTDDQGHVTSGTGGGLRTASNTTGGSTGSTSGSTGGAAGPPGSTSPAGSYLVRDPQVFTLPTFKIFLSANQEYGRAGQYNYFYTNYYRFAVGAPVQRSQHYACAVTTTAVQYCSAGNTSFNAWLCTMLGSTCPPTRSFPRQANVLATQMACCLCGRLLAAPSHAHNLYCASCTAVTCTAPAVQLLQRAPGHPRHLHVHPALNLLH